MDKSGGKSGGKSAWLRAGQELLRKGGVGAVKLQALQSETGLSTGSFYHHFDGTSNYMTALAGSWGSDTAGHLRELSDLDPASRLRKLAAIPQREQLGSLDLAMRDWAGSDAEARRAVARVDATLLSFMVEAFTDLGFDQADSRLRAHVFLAAGVARVAPAWETPGDMVDKTVDLLINRAR